MEMKKNRLEFKLQLWPLGILYSIWWSWEPLKEVEMESLKSACAVTSACVLRSGLPHSPQTPSLTPSLHSKGISFAIEDHSFLLSSSLDATMKSCLNLLVKITGLSET